MVRVVDEGSDLDAPIDKLWKLIDLPATKTSDIRSNATNAKTHPIGENQGLVAFDSDMGGRTISMKLRVTALPPLAQVLEIRDGPMAGSKPISYYTPKGDKTAATVGGDFQSSMIPPAQLEHAAREFLDGGFNDDQAYLKKMR